MNRKDSLFLLLAVISVLLGVMALPDERARYLTDLLSQIAPSLSDVLAQPFWQGLEGVVSGLGIYLVVRRFWNRLRQPHAPSRVPENLPQVLAGKQPSVNTAIPRGDASISKPFEIEPVKRRGKPKPNGEYDIYLCLTITNKTGRPVQDCTGRLVEVAKWVDTPDGPEKRAVGDLYPVLLQWSMQDGGGPSQSFVNAASLDIAALESWDSEVFQVITAEESLRPTYRLQHKYPTLDFDVNVEISAMSGPSMSEEFLIRLWPFRGDGEPHIDFKRDLSYR